MIARLGALCLTIVGCAAEPTGVRSAARQGASQSRAAEPSGAPNDTVGGEVSATQSLSAADAHAVSADAPHGSLTVGQSVAAHLVPLEARDYSAAEVEALFAELRDLSEPYCSHRRQDGPRKPAAFAAYLREPSAFLGRPIHGKYGALSGCWNFVRMNDLAAERDFELVAALFPADHYECASVGVMQPYLMADTLACRTLTTVDIDWRIHDVHRQIVAMADAGRLANPKEATRSILDLRGAWIALRKPTSDRRLALKDLCPNELHARCVRALVSLGRALGRDGSAGETASDRDPTPLQAVRYSLSSLHDARYAFGPPGARSVIYLSNALEPTYTTRDEGQALLALLQAGLAEERRAVVMHHAGGREAFGLYEVWTDAKTAKLQIRTLCKDPYPVVPRDHKSTGHYAILFDNHSPRAPSCASLAKSAGARARHAEHLDALRRAVP